MEPFSPCRAGLTHPALLRSLCGMAVIVSKPCQEIAVCVKHDIGQIVRHFAAGKECLWIILFTAEGVMQRRSRGPKLEDVS